MSPAPRASSPLGGSAAEESGAPIRAARHSVDAAPPHVVALVGRPNVGKSTLFNVLTRSRDALVADRPGVTRDRHYGVCRGDGWAFVVVDTGGLYGDDDELADLTRGQARAAIDEASVVVLVVDAREGLMPGDHRILDDLRRTGSACVLAVNKTDGLDEVAALAEFSTLGVPVAVAVAASHRRNVDRLVDALREYLPAAAEGPSGVEEPDRVRVAICGRPNVGKSTLVNRLLGEERVIVSEVAGTTRDAIAIDLDRDGWRYRLIDTAGVRRRARVDDAIEKFSVVKTLQAMEQAQVVVVMLDASECVTEQDVTVLGHALEAGRALVVAVNKWDGLDRYQRDRCRTELDRKLAFVPWALRVFIAARHGSGLGELVKAINRAWRATRWEVSAGELTKALEIAVAAHQPPLVRGHAPKLRYAHLGGHDPVRVVIHGSRLSAVADSYRRYLENTFRKRFRLDGAPIRLEFREGENPYEGKKNELTARQVQKRRRLLRHARGR
jgi:GTP-binding protein